MARKMRKADIPDNISEEYYQITDEILASFSKYRPPVDLFTFDERIASLYPLFRKGQRLSNDDVAKVQLLCSQGDVFVSRSDHPIYVEHISKQADLVLQDRNLKEGEVADILLKALGMRLEHFFEQPVMPVFELLHRDVLVFTEYITQDAYRTRLFMRRLHTGKTDLVKRALNTFSVGLWMYMNLQLEPIRRTVDRLALGLILLDAGMTKIPSFVLSKTTNLTRDEWEKVNLHPLIGIKMMQKLELSYDEMNHAIAQHHERLDGSGYPQKLYGEFISPAGRLAAVADSFSAMITERPYAKAMTPEAAAQALAADKKKYDGRYADALHNAYQSKEFGVLSPPGKNAPTGKGGKG